MNEGWKQDNLPWESRYGHEGGPAGACKAGSEELVGEQMLSVAWEHLGVMNTCWLSGNEPMVVSCMRKRESHGVMDFFVIKRKE